MLKEANKDHEELKNETVVKEIEMESEEEQQGEPDQEKDKGYQGE